MSGDDEPRGVSTLQQFCRAHGVNDVGDAALRQVVDLVLEERGMFEAALDGIVTKDEAVNVLLTRVYTELLMRRAPLIPEETVDVYRHELRDILFGDPRERSGGDEGGAKT